MLGLAILVCWSWIAERSSFALFGQGSSLGHAKTICITAHPDDEAGAFGGTLLLYGERGVETSVVCLTAGTAAKNRGTARTNEELAKLRTAEFNASCKFLGVTHCEVLNYPDSQLDRANFFEVVGELVVRIRRIRPHVVLTFGTDGGRLAIPTTPWQEHLPPRRFNGRDVPIATRNNSRKA